MQCILFCHTCFVIFTFKNKKNLKLGLHNSNHYQLSIIQCKMYFQMIKLHISDSPSRPFRFAGVLRSPQSLLACRIRSGCREKHRASMATMVINSVSLSGFHANISTHCSLKGEEGREGERKKPAQRAEVRERQLAG